MNYLQYMESGSPIEVKPVYTSSKGNTVNVMRFNIKGLFHTIRDAIKEINDKSNKVEPSNNIDVDNRPHLTNSTPQQNYQYFITSVRNKPNTISDLFAPVGQ